MTSKKKRPKKQTRRRDPVARADIEKKLEEMHAKLSKADIERERLEHDKAELTMSLANVHTALETKRVECCEDRRRHRSEMQKLSNLLTEASREVKAVEQQAQENAEMQARIDAWKQQRQDDHGIHSEASKQNINLRTEKARMHLSLLEIIADLEQIKDQQVAMATAKLRGLVE